MEPAMPTIHKSAAHRTPTQPGARTLGIPASRPTQIASLIHAGFPFQRLARYQKATALPWDKVARITAIPLRTLSRRQKEGRLHPDESDRLWRAAAIFDRALDLFEGDLPAARCWLQQPQPALAGDTPIDFASTDIGAREVENLIGRLEHGVFS
jgi:putative toxin-antitoxin system antitoxin component (TIGR02293 family)